MQESTPKLQLLTQNMWITNTGGKQCLFRRERSQGIIQAVSSQAFDVITLQEVFQFNDYGIFVDNDYKSMLLEEAKKQGYVHYADSPYPGLLRQDSGLLILSKHPIEKKAHYTFANASWAEYMNCKGIVYAKITVPISENESTVFHICTTHMDAHSEYIRVQQMQEIRACLEKWIGPAELLNNENVIITGDWNIDSRGEISNRGGYTDMMSIFCKGGEKEEQKGLEFEDVFASSNEKHPVTYPAANLCIDHVLVSKAVRSRSPVQWKVEKYPFEKMRNNNISDHFGVSISCNLK